MLTQLSSWNDGPAKRAIVDFVNNVTTPDGPAFMPAVKECQGKHKKW